MMSPIKSFREVDFALWVGLLLGHADPARL
jgi:hypothetical protein